MLLHIISAEKTIFSEPVSLVRFPGVDGSFSILKNHAPMIAQLTKGTMIITPENSNTKKEISIRGGLVKVLNNKILVLTDL
jgi:F-type H+-transporting ATPase subunit epsilon